MYLKQYFEENANIILKNNEDNSYFTSKKRQYKYKQHSNPQLPAKILLASNINPTITIDPILNYKMPQALKSKIIQHTSTNLQPHFIPLGLKINKLPTTTQLNLLKIFI